MADLKKISSKTSDAELTVSAQTIITKVSNNQQTFPNMGNQVEKARVLKAEFDAKIISSSSGDDNEIYKKNEVKEKLVESLETIRVQVVAIANKNKAILLLTGFELCKDTKSVAVLGEVTNIKVCDGARSGELKVSCDAVTNAKSYVYFITPEPITPESVWTQKINTKSTYTFTNLEKEKKYHCKIMAIGSYDQESESGIVSRFVQ